MRIMMQRTRKTLSRITPNVLLSLLFTLCVSVVQGERVHRELQNETAAPATAPAAAPATDTVRDLILKDNSIKQFRDATSAVGLLDAFLDDTTKNYTVFAPTNTAIQNNILMTRYMVGMNENPIRWEFHLTGALRNHMVEGATLQTNDIFDGQMTSLQSMQGVLKISQFLSVIGGAKITSTITATNGVLHIVDAVVEPDFFKYSLANLEREEELGPDWLGRVAMTNVTDFVKARPVLAEVRDTGTTFAGCRIRAFNRMGLDYLPQTINRAVNFVNGTANSSDVKMGEFLNASNINQTIDQFIRYSLLPKNYYRQQMAANYLELTFPVYSMCNMWITIHNGRICFNNGCQVATPNPREYMVSNGYGYITDKCVVCPGVAMLVMYASDMTPYNMKDTSQFFVASEWNLRNISMSVGNGSDVTLFASDNTGWTVFNMEDINRLSSDQWKPHQWDELRHMMVQGVYKADDLKDLYIKNGKKPYNLTSLNGENITFDYDEAANKVIVAGGEIFYPDIKGIDGYVHLTTAVPLADSVTHNCYMMGWKYPELYSTQMTLIDTVFLDTDLKSLSPITTLFAPNPTWENKEIELADISKSVLENMIFEGLMWCSEFLARAGDTITSYNGQEWDVTVKTVNDTEYPCFAATQSVSQKAAWVSCITKCDILARNGIVHELDAIMLFETPKTLEPGLQIPNTPGPPPSDGGSGGESGGGGGGTPTISTPGFYKKPTNDKAATDDYFTGEGSTKSGAMDSRRQDVVAMAVAVATVTAAAFWME